MSQLISIAVNRHYVDKLRQGDSRWAAFNDSFENVTLTVGELIAEIQCGHAITSPHEHKRHVEKNKDGSDRLSAYRHSLNFIESSHLGLDHDALGIDAVLVNPFIAEHAAFVHTTASHKPNAPRSRSIFILDHPIRTRDHYTKAASALTWFFDGVADSSCKDAARLFFGAKGCEMRELGNVLSVSVVNGIIDDWEAANAIAHKNQRTYNFDGAAPELQDIREMLRYIPKTGAYEGEWLKVLMAVHDSYPGEDGIAVCEEWSPGYPGEIARKFKSFKQGKGRTIASLVKMAKENGYQPSSKTRVDEELNRMAQDKLDKAKVVDTPATNVNGDGLAAATATDPIDSFAPEFQTDLGNGQRFVKRHGRNLRHVEEWGDLVWNGKVWKRDQTGQVMRWAKETALSIFDEAKVCMQLAQKAQDELKAAIEANNPEAAKKAEVKAEKYIKLSHSLTSWAMKSQSASKLEAMIKLARSESPIPALATDFDKNPWLFNCDNGTINLRNGQLEPHRNEDLITKISPIPFDHNAPCGLWTKTLTRVMDGKDHMVSFLCRLFGYSITGDVSEQILPFPYGSGSNGKTTIIKAILDILGEDYAAQAAPDLLVSGGANRHPTELADLRGMRLIASIEVDDGKRMAEGLVKQLTGGDKIKARFMRQDFFQFEPTHKIFLVANHKPVIRGTDYAIWRRVLLIPFTVKIEGKEKDKHLPEKLKAEYAGILAWLVRGCLEWQNEGLQIPEEVIAATDEYQSESDALARFLEESTVKVPIDTQASKLFKHYQKWCVDNGEDAMNNTRFGLEMTKRGYEKQVQGRNKQTFYLGLGLVNDDVDDEGK